MARPPRLVSRLLELSLPWQYRDEAMGDLEEGFERRKAEPRAARRWYRRQALRSIPAALRLRLQTRHDSNPAGIPLETFRQDLRYAVRSLLKTPGFAIVSIVTLALAVGVNTSIFSLVNAIVFADLPMQETESIALIRGVNPELGVDQGSVSLADFFDLRERARSYESLSALTEGQWVLSGSDEPMRVTGLQITDGLFGVWKLPPSLGREFAPDEVRNGASRVAMLSHGFWSDRYSGDAAVLGQTISLDGMDHTIVGVAHPKLEFASFRSAQVIVPLEMERSGADRTVRSLFVVGRLAAGVSQEVAATEARSIGAALATEHPELNRGWTLWSAPALESLIDRDGNRILILLQLTVAMVILIACANVANMLLARASSRAREIAVRTALGAGRRRLIRQLLTESLLISFGAAVLGLAVAWGLNRSLIWISAGTEVLFEMATLDRRVLLFTLLVSLAAPMFFGLLPALRASGLGVSAAFREGQATDGGRAGRRTRGALVTAQVALALTLMVMAGLVTRTTIHLNARPLGYDSANLVVTALDLPEQGYSDADAVDRLLREVKAGVEALPGFGRVAFGSALPGAEFGARRSIEVEGIELPEDRSAPAGYFHAVSPDFMDVVGLEVVFGRGITDADRMDSELVAVLSRGAAAHFWPDENPVGRRFRVADSDRWYRVAGVTSDVRSVEDTDMPARNIYVALAQDSRRAVHLLARSEAREDLGPLLRGAVWAVDGQIPVDRVRTMDRALYETNGSGYALVTLFVVFGVFAMIMAAVGIYGVMAYSVAQRKNEIGLRLALGAEVGRVRSMVVFQGARLLVVGLVLGLAGSLALSQLIETVLFGVTATDPVTFIGVPLILCAVALVASLIPAVRASRMDPVQAMRSD